MSPSALASKSKSAARSYSNRDAALEGRDASLTRRSWAPPTIIDAPNTAKSDFGSQYNPQDRRNRVDWCPTDYSRTVVHDLMGPEPRLVRAQGGGIAVAFARVTNGTEGEIPANCFRAYKDFALLRSAAGFTDPAQDAALGSGLTQFPDRAANEMFSYRCRRSDQADVNPLLDYFFPSLELLQPPGHNPASAFFVNFINSKPEINPCGVNGTLLDVRRHTLFPSLSGVVLLGSYTQESSSDYLVKPVVAAPSNTTSASPTTTLLVAGPAFTLNLGRDAPMAKALALGPVVGDAMALATVSIFGLGAMALIARKVLAGRRSPIVEPQQVV